MPHDESQHANISALHSSASGAAPAGAAITCPFCGSADTEPMGLFGGQLSTAQHYCRACQTPFQRIKHGDHGAV